jgi:hypothetical protein
MTKIEKFNCSECNNVFVGGFSEAKEHWLSHMEDFIEIKTVEQ